MSAAKAATTEVAEKEDVEAIDVYELVNKQAEGPETGGLPLSFDQYLDLETGELLEFEGSPYKVIKDKSALLEVPFVITDVRIYKGKFGDPVAAIMCVTKEALPGFDSDRKMYVFNDGSTGIFPQIVNMVQMTGRKTAIFCRNGLRKSDYTYIEKDPFDDNKEKEIPATTYYIA